MAKKEAPDDRSGPGDVQITIDVVPGRIRAALTKMPAGARLRAGLASVALVGIIAAGTIIAVSSGSGRGGRPLGAHWVADSDAVITRFGLRLKCARVTFVSPGGAYARVDLETALPCGTYGNHTTLVLHRLHGAWVPEFEASSWTCPVSGLPQAVVVELRLCRQPVVPPRGVL